MTISLPLSVEGEFFCVEAEKLRATRATEEPDEIRLRAVPLILVRQLELVMLVSRPRARQPPRLFCSRGF